MSVSTAKKFHFTLEPKSNDPSKIWLRGEVLTKDWLPSFADIFWILYGIVKCERHNYPDLRRRRHSCAVSLWMLDSIKEIDRLLDDGASLADVAAAVRALEEKHGIAPARRARAAGLRP